MTKNNPKSVKNYNNSGLKKVDWGITIFIISYLNHNPNVKRTSLSMKTGLSYSRFMRYINWLIFIEWVEMIDCDGSKVLRLTLEGMIIMYKIQKKYGDTTEYKSLPEFIKNINIS